MDCGDIRRLRPEWERANVKISQLKGGLTNKLYLVVTDSEAFTVRVPGKNTEFYINREVERKNVELLGTVGIAPRLVDFKEDGKILIVEYIRGTTLTKESFKDPGIRRKAVTAIRQVHESGVKLCNYFNVFSEIRRYQEMLKYYGDEILCDYPVDRMHKMTLNIERNLAQRSSLSVACHNDLLPENFVLTDDGIRVIDWEYAGMNDPCYDIADHLTELDNLGEEEEADIIGLYFRKQAIWKRKRVDLYKLPSRFFWALWAAMQYHMSELSFDFSEYARYQFDQCIRHMKTLETKYASLKL
jgi:thiamine kinase-like enzyme